MAPNIPPRTRRPLATKADASIILVGLLAVALLVAVSGWAMMELVPLVGGPSISYVQSVAAAILARVALGSGEWSK